MEVELELINIKDKGVLKEMLWDYEREIVGEKAEEYKYLDSYWEKPNRFPYFIKVDGKIAGFTLINSYLLVLTEGKTISEFYVKKEYRKNGIGSEAARQALLKWPGKWEIAQMRDNSKAHTFWVNFVSKFTNDNFEEVEMNNEKWNGWIQTFDNSLKYRQSTSAVIMNKLGQILIVQKSSYKDNEWDIPGGGIEEGEQPKLAIIRELSEELGSNKFEITKVSKSKDIYKWPDELINQKIKENKPVYKGQQRTQFLVKFTGREKELRPQKEEIRAIKWVSPNELSAYFVFPNQMEKMKKLLEEFEIK